MSLNFDGSIKANQLFLRIECRRVGILFLCP